MNQSANKTTSRPADQRKVQFYETIANLRVNFPAPPAIHSAGRLPEQSANPQLAPTAKRFASRTGNLI